MSKKSLHNLKDLTSEETKDQTAEETQAEETVQEKLPIVEEGEIIEGDGHKEEETKKEETPALKGNEVEVISLQQFLDDTKNKEASNIQILDTKRHHPDVNHAQLLFTYPDPQKDKENNRSMELVHNPDTILTLNIPGGYLRVLGTKTLMFVYETEQVRIFVYNAGQATTSSMIVCGKQSDIPLFADKISNRKKTMTIPEINEEKLLKLLEKNIKPADKDDTWLRFTKGGAEAKSLKEKYEKEVKTYGDLAKYFLDLKAITIDVAYLLKLDGTLIHAFTK